MRLLDPTYIRDIVDYSFGDESGMGIGGYMKVANLTNTEFISKYQLYVKGGKPYMTLFIDNIRLYRRDCIQYTAVEKVKPDWRVIKDAKVERLKNEDLLYMLSQLPDMQFVIFTGFEDTPTDEAIFDLIPDNILGIYASNAITFGGKVHPIPYGLQRVVASNDKRQQTIQEFMNSNPAPTKLLYINYNVGNNPKRGLLNEYLSEKPWVTTHHPPINGVQDHIYRGYLTNIRDHKFMLCPSGNAEGCECHRDWECLYMKRVPVLEDTAYHREIFKGIPVLFVNSFFNITEQLLVENDYLYQQMQTLDLGKLDIEVLYNNIINEVNTQLVCKKESSYVEEPVL